MCLPNARLLWSTRDAFGVEFQIRNGLYTILLDHKLSYYPRIYIVTPTIDMTQSAKIHTYGTYYHSVYKRELPRICVTLPSAKEWNSSMSFEETFLPWTIEWTEFYELWLLTGEWYGGGVHVQNGRTK